jgi:hypothetical protein
MSQIIRIADKLFDIEAPELQRAIAQTADIRSSRPVCMCQSEPLEMYVAKFNGQYVIKRMPNTAHLHHPACDSFEAPRAVTGIADVEGKAILHDPETEVVTLKLGFSLSKTNTSHAAAQTTALPESAKASISRLSLRATIDYLWDTAKLNRWQPQMAGKRNYSVVHKYVRRALDQTLAKRMAMDEALYMPEPFYSDDVAGIRQRAGSNLTRCAYQRSGKQPLQLLFGEVKAFAEARQGAIVQIRHAPFLPFYLPQAVHEKVLRIFEAELSLWNARQELHLMVLATFAQNAASMHEIYEVAFMLVDKGWMPVGSLSEVQLFERLADEGRAFLKGLRFNADKNERFADVLLTDTERPTAVYLVNGAEPTTEIEELAAECEAVGLTAHFIRNTEVATAAVPEATAR